MTDSVRRNERVLHAHGGSPEGVTNHLLQCLLELLGAADQERDSGSVVPVQASGATLDEMLKGLVEDFFDIVDSSPARATAAELSHVMKTGDGWRAWGYVWFGQEKSTGCVPSLTSPLEVVTAENGELDVRATVLEPERSPGHGCDAVEVPVRQ